MSNENTGNEALIGGSGLNAMLADMIAKMERAAFEKWASDGRRLGDMEMLFAWESWKARAALRSQCRGVKHHGCNYLAPCGSICDKCGQST